MPGIFEPGEVIAETVRHVANTTGIAAWTIYLFQDGNQRTDLGVTLTELGAGFYRFQFTPDVAGYWKMSINTNAATTVFYGDSYVVKSLKELFGGSGYDPGKHSLSKIRGALQIVRDDQIKLIGKLSSMLIRR